MAPREVWRSQEDWQVTSPRDAAVARLSDVVTRQRREPDLLSVQAQV